MSYSSDYGPEYGPTGPERPLSPRPETPPVHHGLPSVPDETHDDLFGAPRAIGPGGPSGPSGPGGRRSGGGGDGGGGGRRGRKKPKKTGWRRFVPSWKLVLAVFGIGTLATVCLVGVAYSMVKVPEVNKDISYQGSTIYDGQGKVILKVGTNRKILNTDAEIGDPIRNAVLSAEDHNFYNEPAISPTGIARAVVNNLTGGNTQGGSTITQQYVKNAYLDQQRTFSRKFKEIFVAIKVNKKYSKQEILRNYLNTIAFGRNTNGVEAAAEQYYGVHANQLRVDQAAVLAANIKQPGYYDPRSKLDKDADSKQQYIDTVTRYNAVLGGLVKMGKLSTADLAKYKDHPPMTKENRSSKLKGQNGFYYQRTMNALKGIKGITPDLIQNGGLKIYTTWNRSLQDKAKTAVESKLKAIHAPNDVRVGTVTMDPTTGKILAAYGGKDYLKRYVDDAFFSTAQVGSSFKPYVLATAINQGIGLRSKMDATAPAIINTSGNRVPKGTPGSFPFTNDEGNPSNPWVDLVTATAKSYNTVYVPLGFKADVDGGHNVFNLAKSAGLPADAMKQQLGQGGFYLGQAEMRPLDQASGYSTLANDGKYITPHSIDKVVDLSGHTYRPEVKRQQAIKPEVARDVQFAMQAVARSGGTGFRAALPGREVAGKTGTTNENKAAWFVGFTPKQYVTAVGMWRFRDGNKKKHIKQKAYTPLQSLGGLSRVNGGDFPAEIWHDFMASALEGKDVTHFEGPAYYGTTKTFGTPKPTMSPTPTKKACGPMQEDDGHGGCKPKMPTTPTPTHSQPCIPYPGHPCGSHTPRPPNCPPQCNGQNQPNDSNKQNYADNRYVDPARPPE